MTEQNAKVRWQEDFLNLKTIALSVSKRDNKTLYIALDINAVQKVQRETLNDIITLLRRTTHERGVYVFLYTTIETQQWVEWFLKSGIQFHSINYNNHHTLPNKQFYDFHIDVKSGFKESYWTHLKDLLPLVIKFIRNEYSFNDMIPMATEVEYPMFPPTVRVEDIDISNYTSTPTRNLQITDMDINDT